MVGIRWAFSSGCWRPVAEEWTLAMASVQLEERQRIGRLVFQRDARAALAGRLLIRKAIVQQTGMAYNNVQLGRTEKGKPYLLNLPASVPQFDFNVSHDGDFVVIASETCHLVGVDLMKVNRLPGSKTVAHFFSTMSRQLSDLEWSAVRASGSESNQLATFYRYWCLKESYVKSLGIGIGLSLDRLECYIHSPLVHSSTYSDVIRDTQISVDGDIDMQMRFEESVLDENHIVSVALKQVSDTVSDASKEMKKFSLLSPCNLLDGTKPIVDPVMNDWDIFSRKPDCPSSRRD